jgi:hypothetical protein
MTSRLFVLQVAVIACLVWPAVVAAQEPVSCGPEGIKHAVIKHKGERPVASPAEGRAAIVVVVGGSFFKSYQTKLAVNGEWRAVMNENQYTFFEVDPGVVRLCWAQRAGARDDNFLLLTAKAGETYYIRGTTVKGISEVDPAEGQKLLRDKTYVTFEVRDER